MSDRERGDGRVSARRWASEQSSGFERTAIKIPEGVSTFQIKAECVKQLDIACYFVGKGNPAADEGTLHFERSYYAHRNIGPNEDLYVCPAGSAKLPCPICDAKRQMARNPKADVELIKDLGNKHRQLWWVRDHGDYDKGWQVWDISFHLFGKQLKGRIEDSDPSQGFEYFADPRAGMTLRVGFGEKSMGGGRPFYETRSIDFKPRKPIPKAEIQALPKLDDMVLILPYEKLQRIFLQLGEDDALPAKGASPKSAPAEDEPWAQDPKAKPAPAADDDWDAEPTAPPPPAAPKPKTKPAPAPVEESGEDDWDAEPATPAPKPKTRPAPEPEAAEAPPPKKPAKPKPQPTEEDDWDAEPEAAAPPAKPKTKPAPAAAPAAGTDDEWDDWDSDKG